MEIQKNRKCGSPQQQEDGDDEAVKTTLLPLEGDQEMEIPARVLPRDCFTCSSFIPLMTYAWRRRDFVGKISDHVRIIPNRGDDDDKECVTQYARLLVMYL